MTKSPYKERQMSMTLYRAAIYCDSVLCPGDCDICQARDEQNDEEDDE